MRNRFHRIIGIGMIAWAALPAAPAWAQFSSSYNFLKAVRDADGAKTTSLLDQPGTTVINTRNEAGESALMIVVKRRDMTWLPFILSRGANPDIRDNDGNTALIVATQIGFAEGVRTLIDANAKVNLGNARGETPLIFAVHNRDLPMVRLLLAHGADPRQADRSAGKSARDYAADDPRASALLKLMDETTPIAKAAIQGPRLR